MSEADKNAVWNSAITRVESNKVAVRGYNIADLMGQVSFGAAVYLILSAELPSQAVARLMDAILVSSIDHGATPPSALAARTVASTGATLSASVAAGIMSINRHHGGALTVKKSARLRDLSRPLAGEKLIEIVQNGFGAAVILSGIRVENHFAVFIDDDETRN